MDGREFVALVMIVFLSIWGSLYLETDLAGYFVLELFIILLMIIAAIGIFYAVASGKSWAWQALSVFFIASMINAAAVYSAAGNATPFALTMFVNIAGLLVAASRQGNITLKEKHSVPGIEPVPIFHIEEKDLVDHIETYKADEEDIAPAPKKKSSRKKASKKKAKKKSKKKIGQSSKSPNSKNLAKASRKK